MGRRLRYLTQLQWLALLMWQVFHFQSAEQWRASALLQLLAIISYNSSTLPALLPSVYFSGRGFGCLAMGCGSPADCTWNQLSNSFSASLVLHSLSLPPAAQPLATGGTSLGHTICRQVCCLSLSQEKRLGTCCGLRSALHPLPSAAPSEWSLQPPRQMEHTPQ